MPSQPTRRTESPMILRKLPIVLSLTLLCPVQLSGETLLARDLGVVVGHLEPGPNNAITDVSGVRVGHETVIRGESINTGVTVVMPVPPIYSAPLTVLPFSVLPHFCHSANVIQRDIT